MMQNNFGPIALLGSGETSLAGGRIFEMIARRYSDPLRIAILETPAGFELNSQQVAGRVGEFLQSRLQNFHPQVNVIPARKRGSPFDPDDSVILEPLLYADLIFMGAGSPTYAVRQLQGSLAWDLVRARHRMGAALVFASAAVIAIGAWVLQVYEVYKVGEDIRVASGLDLFADFNLPLSIIPHWNNTDGGDDVDTSRCFVGLERFNHWCALLPPGQTTVGLDEHTGVIIDISSGMCTVSGVSSVTLLRESNPEIFPAGAEFPVSELGEVRFPGNPEDGIPASALEMVRSAVNLQQDDIPAAVTLLAEERLRSRLRKDWTGADVLRKKMETHGWDVRDTPSGQEIFKRV